MSQTQLGNGKNSGDWTGSDKLGRQKKNVETPVQATMDDMIVVCLCVFIYVSARQSLWHYLDNLSWTSPVLLIQLKLSKQPIASLVIRLLPGFSSDSKTPKEVYAP